MSPVPTRNLAHAVAWLVGLFVAVVVLAVPLGYWSVMYRHTLGGLESETEVIARAITQNVVSQNPGYWEFEKVRIEEYLARLTSTEVVEAGRILNGKNEIVAEVVGALPPPVVTSSYPITDAGAVVGRLEMSRSARPLVRQTGVVGLTAVAVGVGIYAVLWYLPIRSMYRAQNLAKQSEARYRGIFEYTDDIIYLLAPDGKFSSLSPSFERLTGWHPEEWIGKPFASIVHPDDLPRVAEAFQGTLSGLSTPLMELRIARKAGAYFDAEVSVVPVDLGDELAITGIARDVSERKGAEAEIRRQQQLTALIIETIPMRIFWKDRELRYLGCNTLFARDAGLTRPDELIGRTDFDMDWKDQAELYRADDRRVMASNTPKLSYDERQTTPDGGEIWLRSSKVPLRDAANETIGVLGVYEDITERKLAAQALEESERKFRAILDSAVDGILVTDVDTHKFVIANRAICDMLGYPKEALYGLGVEDIHPAEALADVQATFGRQLKGEMRMAQNMPVKRKDGSVFFADVSASPVALEGRTFLVGAFHDVTERMNAEERIRDSEARYRSIFEYASDIIILLNSNGTFRSISPAGERMTGWKAEEWTGRPFASLVHADDLAEADAAFRKALAGETVPSLRLRVAAKSGEYFSADISVTPLDRDVIMGIARDVSERQRVEAEIRRLNEELEKRVEERTRQLVEAQEELVRKEKLAVLGQVAGSVGHELRNPLGVMNNAVYFLQTVLSDADDTTREYLGIIKDEIAGSERIVSDLLDSVRTKPPRPETVGVATLIEQTLHKYAVPPNVTVRLDLPDSLPALEVDPQQIHQVFRNLISNGVEAMAEGGELEIRAVADPAADKVAVSVRDTGTGIPPDVLPKLFQPLFTTKPRGIGLGLVVVKNLTESNGGTLTVQTEVGRGTTFTVTLPAARSAGGEA